LTSFWPGGEQAIETAALMLGTDKSRGYCLEMICADFLAGANLENEDATVLLQSMSRFFSFLPGEQRQAFIHEERFLNRIPLKQPRRRLDLESYEQLCLKVLRRDGWRCQSCGTHRIWRFTTMNFAATAGMILRRI